MDDVDRAQAAEERLRAITVDNWAMRRPHAIVCVSCGEEIPPDRRDDGPLCCDSCAPRFDQGEAA